MEKVNRVASIDIGSQTIRFMVADCTASGTLVPVYRDMQIVRLGEGMNRVMKLGPEAVERAVTCISSFVVKAKECGAAGIYAVATACVRNAENSRQFLETVFNTAGITPVVLSGTEEACLSLRGVQSVFSPSSAHSLIIDIGGGSTELTLLYKNDLIMAESLPLGVVNLAEHYLHSDPPSRDEICKLEECVTSVLHEGSRAFSKILSDAYDFIQLVGTAGTMTTLAAMDRKMRVYDPDKINGHVLDISCIKQLFGKMIFLPREKRKLLAGLEPGRADVIIPGTIIILRIMETLGQRIIQVSDAGLLEGVILDKITCSG